jgi:hypothetical protein
VLVIDDSAGCNFPLAKCHQFHASDGSACPPNRPLLYEGKCRSTSWPCQIGSYKRTLQADYFGQVSDTWKLEGEVTTQPRCPASALPRWGLWSGRTASATTSTCAGPARRARSWSGNPSRSTPSASGTAARRLRRVSLTIVPLTLPSAEEVKWPDRRCYRVVGDPLECESKMELAPPADDRGPSPGPAVVERGTQFHLQCDQTQTFSLGSISNCLAESKDGTCLKRSRKTRQCPRGDLRSIISRKYTKLSGGKA